jgi:hypothetical protein
MRLLDLPQRGSAGSGLAEADLLVVDIDELDHRNDGRQARRKI